MENKKSKIVAVNRNQDGSFSKFKTDDNKILNYEMAKDLISKGKISNAELFKGKDGKTYVRGKTDGIKANNLSELEEF